MSLELIVGPPNSGRAGEILGRFRESLGRGPVLVVPTADDAEAFEGELTGGGVATGGSVLTFGGLFGEVARACELPHGRGISRVQSVWIAGRAIERAPLRRLSGSAAQPGFAAAVADLVDELQAAGFDPASLELAAKDAGEYEREIASLYSGWGAVRNELGLSDTHQLAQAAIVGLRRSTSGISGADPWGRRPVFLYGFDDLTHEQLELVGLLAGVTEVAVAVTYDDRAALAARARLHQQLRELHPEELIEKPPREADPANTPSATVRAIDAGFLEPGTDRIEPEDDLVLLRSSGERAEAELVGTEVARLLSDGVDPDRIAIVRRNPGRSAALWSRVLEELGIPAAVEASIPLASTAVGRALISLGRAATPEGTSADLISFLRLPGRARPWQVDMLERDVRRNGLRTASEAEAAWLKRERRKLFELADLREAADGGSQAKILAGFARRLAERPLERVAARPDSRQALELRAAAEAERALMEIAALVPAAATADLGEALASVAVPLRRGPIRGRVRVVSPYRVRARRFSHLVIANLQEGEFPRHDPGSPLLSDERRAALGLPERVSQEDEERYLFAICLSRPESGLLLSWQESDEEGGAVARSPFVDEVRHLLGPEPPEDPEEEDPLIERIGLERGPGDVVLPPERASSVRELRRSVAAFGDGQWRELADALEIPAPARDVLIPSLEAASVAIEDRRRRPRDLRVPAVLEALEGNDLFGASTLEEYRTCSYRWFVGHELRPRRLDPVEEPLTLGGLAHRVLEALYAEAPGGTPRPAPATLPEWRARATALVEEAAPDFGLAMSNPVARASIRRVEGLLHAFCADEAAADPAAAPRPDLLEAAFGTDRAAHDPLVLDGARIHGAIDRVDVALDAGREVGVVTDYKLSSKVTPGKKLEDEGKLQLQLYMLALRDVFGIEPAGGIYRPLRGTRSRRPRGLLRGDMAGTALAGMELVGTDLCTEEEFEEGLADAAKLATEIAERIRAGRITRDPLDNECPPYCAWQAICRRERGQIEPKEDEPDEENGE